LYFNVLDNFGIKISRNAVNTKKLKKACQYNIKKEMYLKKLIEIVKKFLEKRRKKKEFEKKIEELKKRDPFTYNH
jgi:hypothetical protein